MSKITKNEIDMDTILDVIYPVGSVYTNYSDSTNPGTLLGVGTWEAIAGRVVVGLDSGQTEFDTAGETGGAKTHTLSTNEIPAHTHPINSGNNYPHQSGSSYSHTSGAGVHNFGTMNQITSTGNNTTTASDHNNLQPYVVCYVWRRTA